MASQAAGYPVCYNRDMPTILILEDEPELVRVLKSYLENAGMKVIFSKRGDEGLSLFETSKPDLVILDLNLPGMDGLDVAESIRRQGDVPLIMVTARVSEADRLTGLEMGADDYVVKPYSPREVVARVKAVLRRASLRQTKEQRIILDDLEIDLDAHQVRCGGVEIALTPSEFNLLTSLASQPGRTFTRLQLLESVQGSAYEGYERTIDAHIKNLRAKLGGCASAIETVFGVGYRFRKSQ